MTTEQFTDLIFRAAATQQTNLSAVNIDEQKNEIVILLPPGKGLLYPNLVPSIAMIRPVEHPRINHPALEISSPLSDVKEAKF